MKATKPLLIFGTMLVVGGCGPLVPVESTTRVEGSYDTMTRYDFSTASGMLTEAAGSWTAPDRALTESIIGQVSTMYGSDIAQTLSNQFGSQIQSQIRTYLQAESPSWVFNMGPHLDGVDAKLKTVDAQSTWVVGETSGGQYEVTQIWNGFSVFKDPACRGAGNLICEQTHYTTEALLDAEYPIEIVSTRSEGVTTSAGLFVDSHSVEFNYGRLGLYMLVDALLPPESREGSVGLRDVALGAINCRGLAGRLAGDDGIFGFDLAGVRIGLSLNDLIGSCQDGIFGIVNRFVDRFHIPLNMNIKSNARLVDTNRDGRINRLDDGKVDGMMNLTRGSAVGQEGPVSGEFTGFRVGSFGK
ncbi:MAG: hypothetical protein ACNA8W_23590 [Bradymonadaceae bacterium]